MRRRTAKTRKHLVKHVRRRALERFGWADLSTQEIESVVKAIQSGTGAVFVDRQSHNVTRWIVSLRDKSVAVAFDKERKMIRTVMPVEFLTGGGVVYDGERAY